MSQTGSVSRFQGMLQSELTPAAGGDENFLIVEVKDGKSNKVHLRIEPPRSPSPIKGLIGRVRPTSPGPRELTAIESATISSFKTALTSKFGAQSAQTAIRQMSSQPLTMGEARKAWNNAARYFSTKKSQFESALLPAALERSGGGDFSLREMKSTQGGEIPPATGQHLIHLLSPRVCRLISNLFEDSLVRVSSEEEFNALAQTAIQALDKLLRLPGMSEARVCAILDFASKAGSHEAALPIIRDLSQPLDAPKDEFHGSLVAGATFGSLEIPQHMESSGISVLTSAGRVESDHEVRSQSDEPHDELNPVGGFHRYLINEFQVELSQKPRVTFNTVDGNPVSINEQCLKDQPRFRSSINGRLVVDDSTRTRTEGQMSMVALATQFRSHFPSETKSDTAIGNKLALQASVCMAQTTFNAIAARLQERLGGIPKSVMNEPGILSHDLWQRDDKTWVLRSTLMSNFGIVATPGMDPDEINITTDPYAVLATVECTIDISSGEPRISAIGTDIVFNGPQESPK